MSDATKQKAMAIIDANREKALRTHQLLLEYYGQPILKARYDPLSELVRTILSQNTNDGNTARAYASLQEHFPSWEALLAADSDEVAKAIRVGGLANVKAPRIQSILRTLCDERGHLSLDFLADLSTEQARAYLTALPGVGPKTASCVLLFSLGKPALPVDTHVHRVALRVGLVPPKASAEKTAELLEQLLPDEFYYPFHLNVIRHGRTLCQANKPRCDLCPLAALCAYAVA